MPQATSPAAVPQPRKPGDGLKPPKMAGTEEHDSARPKTVSLEVRAPPLPRIEGLIPLSTLVGRMAQHTYNGLTELIDTISSSGMSEGDKKAKIVEFALESRKHFIKLYVLVQWAKNAKQVHDVINITGWMKLQNHSFIDLPNYMHFMQRRMMNARWELNSGVWVINAEG